MLGETQGILLYNAIGEILLKRRVPTLNTGNP